MASTSGIQAHQGRNAAAWSMLLLLVMSLLYFCANLEKIIIPGTTFNEVQSALGVDAVIVTRISSMFFYVYAFMQLVVGPLSDRYGGVRVMLGGALVMGIGAVLSSFSLHSVSFLMACRALTGLGAAVMYLATVKEIARTCPGNCTLYLGLLLLIGYSGSIAGSSPFIAGVHRFGLQRMVLASGILCLASYAMLLALIPRVPFPPVNRQAAFSLKRYFSVFRNRQNLLLIFFLGLPFGLYYVFQMVIGKKLLEDYCGMSAGGAGIVMTVTMLIAAGNGFVAALVSRLLGNRRRPIVLFSSFGACVSFALLFAALLFDCHSKGIVISGLLLSALAGNVSPIGTSLIRENSDEGLFATTLSISNSFAYFVPAILGALSGHLMDCHEPTVVNGIRYYGRDSYLLVVGMMLVISVFGALVSLGIKETMGRRAADRDN